MDIEIGAEAKDKRLNRQVAITVVALSIFMGLSGVKDGNIVQAMQQAQSDAVDTWGEYQATKTKLHIDETALAQTRFLALEGGPRAAGLPSCRGGPLCPPVSVPSLTGGHGGPPVHAYSGSRHPAPFSNPAAAAGPHVPGAYGSAGARSLPRTGSMTRHE